MFAFFAIYLTALILTLPISLATAFAFGFALSASMIRLRVVSGIMGMRALKRGEDFITRL